MTRGTGRAPKALLLAAALVGVIEASGAGPAAVFSGPVRRAVGRTIDLGAPVLEAGLGAFAPDAQLYHRDGTLRRLARRPENAVLMEGPSSLGAGVDESLLNERFRAAGVAFFNLNLQAVSNAELFSERGRVIAARPAAVVLMVHRSNFSEDFDHRRALLPQLFHPAWVPWLWREWGWRGAGPLLRVCARGALCGAVAAFRHRRILRRSLLPVPPGARVHPWTHWRWPLQEDYDRWPLRRYQKGFFTALLESYRRAGVPLLLLETPLAPVAEYRNRLRHGDYLDFVEAECRRLGLRFLTNRDYPRFSAGDFRDQRHLNASGRAKFTAYLEREIGALLASAGSPGPAAPPAPPRKGPAS